MLILGQNFASNYHTIQAELDELLLIIVEEFNGKPFAFWRSFAGYDFRESGSASLDRKANTPGSDTKPIPLSGAHNPIIAHVFHEPQLE